MGDEGNENGKKPEVGMGSKEEGIKEVKASDIIHGLAMHLAYERLKKSYPGIQEVASLNPEWMTSKLEEVLTEQDPKPIDLWVRAIILFLDLRDKMDGKGYMAIPKGGGTGEWTVN